MFSFYRFPRICFCLNIVSLIFYFFFNYLVSFVMLWFTSVSFALSLFFSGCFDSIDFLGSSIATCSSSFFGLLWLPFRPSFLLFFLFFAIQVEGCNSGTFWFPDYSVCWFSAILVCYFVFRHVLFSCFLILKLLFFFCFFFLSI